MNNYWDIRTKDFQDKKAQDKLLEEINTRSSNPLPDDAADRLFPTLSPAESPYNIDVSDTTVPMRGREDSLPSAASLGNAPSKPVYEIEEDAPTPVPVTPPVVTPSDSMPPAVKNDVTANALLSTNNDDARRQAELVALRKRDLPNKIASFGAGIGDAISASASAFGGKAPGGFQQRLIERQDKGTEAAKKDIETGLRNDAKSDISKQYQALIGQFLQKDPSDPTILGLTANQIAEKIPQIEKLAALRQENKLKTMEFGNQRDAKLNKQEAEDTAMREKKQASIDHAKQQAGIIRGTIKDIADRKLIGYDTAGPTGSSLIAPFDKPDLREKLATIASNIAIAEITAMRQNSPTGGALGNISDKDMATLMAIKGSLSQRQSPNQLKQTLGRLDELYTRIEGYDADVTAPWKDKQPGAPSGPRLTKSGLRYTPGK